MGSFAAFGATNISISSSELLAHKKSFVSSDVSGCYILCFRPYVG